MKNKTKFIFCRIGLHDWYIGCFQTGLRSKFTGDHIGRREKHCLECGEKRLFIGQFSKEFQEIVKKRLGFKKLPKHIAYKDNDWLDIETKIRLAGNATINPEGVTYI